MTFILKCGKPRGFCLDSEGVPFVSRSKPDDAALTFTRYDTHAVSSVSPHTRSGVSRRTFSQRSGTVIWPLSRFQWKTTASGYHRCQQGARRGRWGRGGDGAGHDAVGSGGRRGWRNSQRLHILRCRLAGGPLDAGLANLAEPLLWRPE